MQNAPGVTFIMKEMVKHLVNLIFVNTLLIFLVHKRTKSGAEYNIKLIVQPTNYFKFSAAGIVDRKECLLHSISHEDQPLSHAIATNAKALVEAQCFLFDTLWNNAIPAQEKIKEIEEGVKPPFTETLRDPHEIQRLVFDLVKSAKQEILMLLFTATASGMGFLREEYKVVIQFLKEAVTQNGIRVRILASKGIQEQIEKIIAKKRRQEEEKEEDRKEIGIAVRVGKQEGKFEFHLIDTLQQQLQQRLQTNVSILIVDSKVSLVEELKAYHKK